MMLPRRQNSTGLNNRTLRAQPVSSESRRDSLDNQILYGDFIDLYFCITIYNCDNIKIEVDKCKFLAFPLAYFQDFEYNV